jgi:hypothetical protein
LRRRHYLKSLPPGRRDSRHVEAYRTADGNHAGNRSPGAIRAAILSGIGVLLDPGQHVTTSISDYRSITVLSLNRDVINNIPQQILDPQVYNAERHRY